MKILFISHSSQIGGATRSLMYLIKSLNNEDYILLVPNEGPILKKYLENGIKYNICNIPALFYSQYSKITLMSLLRFIYYFFNILKVRKYINKGYNVIYFNEIVFAPTIYILKLIYGKKIKIIVHSRVSMPRYRIGISKKLFLLFLKKADYIIGIGEAEIEAFKNFINKKIIINPVCLEGYIPKEKKTTYLHLKHNIDEKKIIVGIFGQIHKGKGQDFIINYFIRNLNENLILIFFGDGNMKQELEEKVKNSVTKKNIIFAGFIDNIYESLEGCDFIIRAEENGMLGRDILEANSLGIPILTSKDKKINYEDILIEGKNGYSFEQNNEIEFKEKLEKMLLTFKSLRGFASKNKFGFNDEKTYGEEFKNVLNNI